MDDESFNNLKKLLSEIKDGDMSNVDPLQVLFAGLVESMQERGMDPLRISNALISTGVAVFSEHADEQSFDMLIATMEGFKKSRYKTVVH